MKTDVAIIGSGPSGLILSQLLDLQGIDNVILERRSLDYVLSRIRAGVLESGFVKLLREAKAAERLDVEGEIHSHFDVIFNDTPRSVELEALTGGNNVVVYGQTEVTRDLIDVRKKSGGTIIELAEVTSIEDILSEAPKVRYRKDGKEHIVSCKFVAGCDGFHGPSRKSIPQDKLTTFEKIYPFGWMGVMSETPPVSTAVTYVRHQRGFALCSKRNSSLSRYYIQCALDNRADDWSDDHFWNELSSRLPNEISGRLVTGPSIEKSVTPLRSMVCETMRYGNLFLAGDAAHIVPPTGAKGLNLASSDIYYLSNALIDYFKRGYTLGLDSYSHRALSRVWKAERFSWWMTNLLHIFPDTTDFEEKMKISELEYIFSSKAALTSFAENYVGLPY